MGVFDGLGDKAKDLADKAKGLATDENIETAAEKLKERAPDSLDGAIDTVADKLQGLNDDKA